MSSPVVSLVNEQPLTLEKTIEYLETSGRLSEVMLEVLSLHAISEVVQPMIDSMPSETVEQLLIEFRTQQDLIDANEFQTWLDEQGLSYELFRRQFIWTFAVSQLKDQISEPQLNEYFEACKPSLDQVILSWIGVDTETQAKNLCKKLDEGSNFAQLAEVYANPDNEDSFGLDIPLTLEQLPEALIDQIGSNQTSDVIEPVAIDNQWYVFRVEEFQPAELDEMLKEELKAELFEQWILGKVQEMTVTLQVN